LRYSVIWSAWLDGVLLGEGDATDAEEAEAQAMNLVTDLITPEEVERIQIDQRPAN
jgi:hypothetical protein